MGGPFGVGGWSGCPGEMFGGLKSIRENKLNPLGLVNGSRTGWF